MGNTLNLNSFYRWKSLGFLESFDENMVKILEEYERLGPLIAIFLPLIEAFLPFLPLMIFVVANSAIFGLFKGFLYSWIGTTLGSLLVFWVIRKLEHTSLFMKIKENKQVQRITLWVEQHGFGPLFILLCFPFSPSSVINVVAGMSKIKFGQFALAVLLGKSVMIFSIAYIGSSVTEFAKNPIRTIIVGVSIISFWILGKFIERFLRQRKQRPT